MSASRPKESLPIESSLAASLRIESIHTEPLPAEPLPNAPASAGPILTLPSGQDGVCRRIAIGTSFSSGRQLGRQLGHAPRHAARVLLRPAAFLKLMFCCHAAQTEIGGFGIGEANDSLTIESFALVHQTTTLVTVAFDDNSVADHVDRYADAGIGPERSMRVWIHTHPGSSAAPSGTDEQTFARSFGSCDWSAMLIQSRGTERYCRLQFNAGPGGEAIVPVEFDWAGLPGWLLENAAQLEGIVNGWREELLACVTVQSPAHFAVPHWRTDSVGFEVARGHQLIDPLLDPFDRQLDDLLDGHGRLGDPQDEDLDALEDERAFPDEDAYEDRQFFRQEGRHHGD